MVISLGVFALRGASFGILRLVAPLPCYNRALSVTTTFLLDPGYYKVMVRKLKAAMVGLEKLSDADAATYLTSNYNACGCLGMANPVTADMVHEARIAKI